MIHIGTGLEKDILFIDRATGEAIGGMDYGARVTEQNEIQRRIDAQARRLEHELEHRRKEGMQYYFVRSDSRFEGVSPAMVTRLIYLSTYARYDNAVMRTRKTHMERKNLPAVLGLSARHTANFWKEVSPKYVYEDENGFLYLNEAFFKRGKLQRKGFIQYQQFYDKGVRALYSAANGMYHKQLGYLFKLLPFINIEYNLVCWNPFETDINKIELLSISEFCEQIGYDISHIDRLLKVYNKVRFPVDGRMERFCTMIYNGLDTYHTKICINPNIFYDGTNSGYIEVSKLCFDD